MKYTKEQRLDIDRRIYNGEITKYEAAKQMINFYVVVSQKC